MFIIILLSEGRHRHACYVKLKLHLWYWWMSWHY